MKLEVGARVVVGHLVRSNGSPMPDPNAAEKGTTPARGNIVSRKIFRGRLVFDNL